MNVVNPGVLAELDISAVSTAFVVLLSLLGAAMLLLLACAVVRSGSTPIVAHVHRPVTQGPMPANRLLPARALARACGSTRAPPGSLFASPDCTANPLRMLMRR